MLHITKLAVGVRDIDHLRDLQAERQVTNPPLRHRTRNFPRRRDEIIDGGSIYWIIGGSMLVRQRILDITRDHWDDNTPCSALILDPTLVPLEGRPTKAFQGWRYLDGDDAPMDRRGTGLVLGIEALPPLMRQELMAVGLL